MRKLRNVCVCKQKVRACEIRVCFPRAAEKGSVALSQRKYTASENMPIQRTGLSLVGFRSARPSRKASFRRQRTFRSSGKGAARPHRR